MFVLAAYLHVLMGILSLVASLAFLVSYSRNKNKKIFVYFLLLLFVSSYTLSFGLPLIFYPSNLALAAWGFVVGYGFVVLAEVVGLHTIAVRTNQVIDRHIKLFSFLNILYGAIFVGLLIRPLQEPIIHNSGLIFWNINPVSGWALGLQTLLIAGLWSWYSYKNSKYVEDKWSKIKSTMLSIDGISWGVAALIYITTKSLAGLIVAFILMIGTLLMTAMVFWFVRIREKKYNKLYAS